MSNNRDRRGNRGGKRAIRVHRPHADPNDERRVEARAQARAAQVALDKRIAAEAAQAHEQAAEAERRALAQRRADRAAATAEAERRRGQWTLGQARSLVRQGYSLAHVVQLTGWDADWLT